VDVSRDTRMGAECASMPFDRPVEPVYRLADASWTADTDCNQTVILVQSTKQEVLVQHPRLMTTFVGDSCDNKVRLERGTVPEGSPAPDGRVQRWLHNGRAVASRG
jgi:hypothetical protein